MYGFKQEQKLKLQSSEMTVITYSHDSGAKLIYLDTGREEKAFGAFFRTVPEDSTGVFHILEHSIVSGSEKYPVASPILYMMQNSMNTYVNAVTYQGKTGYMCSSCNGKDFENLMHVFLDAVFHPLLTKEVFMREGWNLEKTGDNYAVQGVVFNEMCGAFSSVEMQMFQSIRADLFPDTYQRYVAGGQPRDITKLSYEDFLRTYREFYSADNCVLVLSGNLDLDAALKDADEYLKNAPKATKKHAYTKQKAISADVVHEITVTDERQLKENTNLAFTYCLGDYGDVEDFYAANILLTYLLDDNSSLLKHRLLESGLMQDVKMFLYTENQIAVTIIAYHTERDRRAEIEKIIDGTFSEIAAGGADKDALRAVIAQLGFNIRESCVLLPEQGVRNFASVADNVFYGLPVTAYFEDAYLLDKIEKGIDGGYFEKFTTKYFIKNAHRAVSAFVPVLGEAGKERVEALENVTGGGAVSAEAADKYLRDASKITADSPEAVAKMPVLKVSDIDAEIKRRNTCFEDGNLITDADTGGLSYIRYYFSTKGFNKDELSAVRFLASALIALPTEHYTKEELSFKYKRYLGRYMLSVFTHERGDSVDTRFKITLAFLDGNGDKVLPLIAETIRKSRFGEKDVKKILEQEIADAESAIAHNALSIALIRSQSAVSPTAARRAYTEGYEYYEFIKRQSQNIKAFISLLEKVSDKLFVRKRLITGITGHNRKKYACLDIPEGEPCGDGDIALSDIRESAFAVPSGVNFNVKSFRFGGVAAYSGKLQVLSNLLSLGYLWHNLREKGGAYGTGFNFLRNGTCTMYSVRDPKIDKTYDVFDGVGEFLKKISIEERRITGSVISAAASYFKPLTIEDESVRNELDCLRGLGPDEIKKTLSEVLSFNKTDVEAYIKIFENQENVSLCTAGNGGALKNSRLSGNIIKI